MISKIESGMKEKMLKTASKRKQLLLLLIIFSILFGRLVVSSPALADENQPEPPDQEPPETSETSDEPGHVEGNGTDEDEKDEDEGTGDEKDEDKDDDGVNDDDEEKLSRDVQVDLDDDTVEIESKLRVGERKDEFKVEIKGDNDFRIKYDYESEVGKEESDIDLEVRFTQLIEYIDSGSDGFDETDIIGEPHSLEDFTFTLNSLGISDTGERLYEINATSEDEVLKMCVLVPEDFTLINGEQITPTSLKIDIEIHNFPYTDTEGVSQLALKTRMEVEIEPTALIGYLEDDDGNLVGLNTTIGNYTVEFTWVSTVSVDGQSSTVGTSIFKSKSDGDSDGQELELRLYLLYPRGEHIIHDPRIGIPLRTLPYAQGVQVAVPKPIVIVEKLEDIIPHIPIELLFVGSLMATLVVVVVSVPMILRRKLN